MVSDLAEARDYAACVVRSMIMESSAEDWRDWVVHVSDAFDDEIFEVSFSSVSASRIEGRHDRRTPHFMPLLRRLDLFVTEVAPPVRARLRRLPARAPLHARAGPEMVRQAPHRRPGPLSPRRLLRVPKSGTKGDRQPQPLHDMALLWSNLAGRVPPWAEDY